MQHLHVRDQRVRLQRSCYTEWLGLASARGEAGDRYLLPVGIFGGGEFGGGLNCGPYALDPDKPNIVVVGAVQKSA